MQEESGHILFDRAAAARKRARAAGAFPDHAFLFERARKDIENRLRDVKRDFPRVLQIGARGGRIALDSVSGASALTAMDAAGSFLEENDVCADEGGILPFDRQAFNLVVSPLCLHAVNDLPGALVQARRCLKPDGLFIGALFSGQTLHELRTSLAQAEMNICGGASPRVAPMAHRQDLAALMQRAGYALPVVDTETVTVTYSDIFRLMTDLRGMGETNIAVARQKTFSRRSLFIEAGQIYRERFGDAEGRIPATFEISYLTGWAPHESQQKPLKRGSAERSLADALAC